tara:strand:+ start:496 stop:957 length:462 start_codon:yes stop_codon:yes gene_type:complete
MKKIIGRISIDSGQVLIGDPCYLSDWQDADKVVKRAYRHTTEEIKSENFSAAKILVWPDDFSNYETYKENGISMNEMLRKGIYEEIKREIDPSYSYSGACSITMDSENQAGELANGLAIVSSTGYGDGSYPVYAEYSEGRVKSLTVEFFKGEE